MNGGRRRQRFTNAISGDANFLLRSAPAVPSPDMVILHGRLGGCSSIGEAMRAAKRPLRSALPHADTGSKEDSVVAGRQQ